MGHEVLFLIGFLVIVTLILLVDLGLLGAEDNPKAENYTTQSLKKAALMSFLVISIAVGFYFLIQEFGHLLHGIENIEQLQEVITKHHHPTRVIPGDLETSIELYNKNLALEYITGYIVEYALSVDNIFVILMIFTSFGVNERYYHKVLIWGVLGAILMRFLFIFIGASLIARFDWIMYIFGTFLAYSGLKMLLKKKEEKIDPSTHPVVKFARKHFKLYDKFVEDKFFIKKRGIRLMTPLFLVLLIIEFTDLIFAVDSIPAIFSVTHDPYIVFFSNIFAVLGLRSMFFLLGGIVDKFRYLKTGLAFLLIFIGAKMLLQHHMDKWKFSTTDSLFVILGILGISIIASVIANTGFMQKKKA